MPTYYNISSSVEGTEGYGLPFSNTIYTARLAATTDTTFTVPSKGHIGMASSTDSNRYIAVFNYAKAEAKDVWVALNNTAAAPAGATFASAVSELNPSARYVKAGDVIHFFAVSANTDVSISLYSIE